MSQPATIEIESVYEPQPKQMLFHQCLADEIFYGGAAGGGKTRGLFEDANNLCMTVPGVVAVIFRRTYPELEATHIRSAMKLPGKLGKYNGGLHEFHYVNGSILEFRHCEYEKDVWKYWSSEWDALYIDQLEQFTEFQYKLLRSRVRTTKVGIKPKVKTAGNPGGVGHAWVKKRFIDPSKAYQVWTPKPEVDMAFEELDFDVPLTTRCFIFASIFDNPILLKANPEYLRILQDLPEDERRALLEGDWDVFAGQVFKEWRRDIHVIVPFNIPASWQRWRAVDYGREAPFSCGFYAKDNDGHIYRYNELYQTGLDAEEQAITIKGNSGLERYEATLADPSMFRKESDGKSIADRYAKQIVPLTAGQNDRLLGKNLLHEYLKVYRDQDGALTAKFKVFDNCVNFIRTIPALVHSKTNVEDVDTKGEDHCYDECRYLLTGVAEPGGAGKQEFEDTEPTLVGNLLAEEW